MLLVNFIIPYSRLLKHFILPHFLLIGYGNCALRKKPVIAPFIERFKTATWAWLANFISSYSKLLKHFIFANFLLIEGYGKCALRKEPVIAPIVERVKVKQLLWGSLTSEFHLYMRNLINNFMFHHLLVIEDYE